MQFHDRLGLGNHKSFSQDMAELRGGQAPQGRPRAEKALRDVTTPEYDHHKEERRRLERVVRETEEELEKAFIRESQAKEQILQVEAEIAAWLEAGKDAAAQLDPQDHANKGQRLQRRLVQLQYDATQLVGHMQQRLESWKARLNKPGIDGLREAWRDASEAGRREFLLEVGASPDGMSQGSTSYPNMGMSISEALDQPHAIGGGK